MPARKGSIRPRRSGASSRCWSSAVSDRPSPRPSPASGSGGEDGPQPDRIRWRCRRGLLELDCWLGGFWAAHRATLQPHETAALERLLDLPDMEILDRLQGRSPAGDADLDALVRRLQHFREAR
ncbi:FAD assembly factor SdhE [Thiobacillus sedimenti]|uniref:FAD assembly factor SdhE n=1 Tax=Thiobacillus sedimenti TaxID=3110231 RepID=A0ABZ1CES5_9PROT|nr:succinate dehydrogenase assembly factor 2 [Thiobacillus sp. SCUT-2]WRS37854.1 succinate dehydrogenase assembly factor 2 [Thiobacillus sp. SCUT-2]